MKYFAASVKSYYLFVFIDYYYFYCKQALYLKNFSLTYIKNMYYIAYH
jgi:hypothetical protein